MRKRNVLGVGDELGNAVCVNVVEWIMRRIAAADALGAGNPLSTDEELARR